MTPQEVMTALALLLAEVTAERQQLRVQVEQLKAQIESLQSGKGTDDGNS